VLVLRTRRTRLLPQAQADLPQLPVEVCRSRLSRVPGTTSNSGIPAWWGRGMPTADAPPPSVDGHRVVMSGGADNIGYIFATGTDHDSWVRSATPYYGTYREHRLKKVIRGRSTLTIRGKPHSHELRITEGGWTARSANIYTYRGRTCAGYLNQGGTYTMDFHCNAHTLTWIGKQDTDKETRASRKP
jgi:hypothetical protein